MKLPIADALSSKKFLAFLATLIVVIGNKCIGHWGYELDASQVALLVGSAATYMLGQGIADHGKTAADTNAAVAAAIAMPNGVEKDAALALFHGALQPITPSNANVLKSAQAGFARLGLLVAIAAIGVGLVVGCTNTSRLKTLDMTMAGLVSADISFDGWEKQHEIDMAHDQDVTTRAAALAAHADFIVKRDKARKAITAALNSVGAGYKLDDDVSVANAVQFATAAYALLKDLGVPL